MDISIPAVDAAARRYPECEWIVANADRFLPYADRSFSIVMSITARMNSGEFRRVLPRKQLGRRHQGQTDLDAQTIHDVLVSIYRPRGFQPAEAMRLTLSLDLLLFRPSLSYPAHQDKKRFDMRERNGAARSKKEKGT